MSPKGKPRQPWGWRVSSFTRSWLELELRGGLHAVHITGPAILQPALHANVLDTEVRLRHRAPDQVGMQRVGPAVQVVGCGKLTRQGFGLAPVDRVIVVLI